jgi:UDP-N-acetylmuramyl pentapeptide synthase
LSELAAELAAVVRPGDVVLLKGSRRMQLEKLLDLLPATGAQS